MSCDAEMNRGASVGTGAGAQHRRSERMVLVALMSGVLLSACSGKIITTQDEDDGSGGSLGSGGSSASGAAPGTGGDWPMTGGGPSTGGSEPYVDPECPDEEPPEPYVECDPLEPFKDCPDGYGCYPFLEYPYGEGCGHAMFGSVCIPAGVGEQGDFCDDSYCAPGFMCVVGATGGKRCGQICEPVRDFDCDPGLICGETDIQGYGVCF